MYTFQLVFILAGISSIRAGPNSNTCSVYPKDLYIKAGENITITCQSACDGTSKIYWKLNNDRIDDSLSSMLNRTHTVLSLRNFTHPRATLQCYTADTQQVIGGTIIETYSAKPRNISCVHYKLNQEESGGLDSLTCTWEHHMNPPVNYAVESVFHKQKEILQCHSKKTTCTLTELFTLRDDNITVTVKATTHHWNVSSEPRTFALHDISKSLPPKDLEVADSAGSLSVKWRRLSPLEPGRCEVKCRKVLAGGEIVECDHSETGNNTRPYCLLNDEANGSIMINNVDSCTTYGFSVRCVLGKAIWSDWSKEKLHVTKLNKNHVNLHLWRKVSELEENGLRKVRVMWKGIPKDCGGTFDYTIKQTHDSEHMTGGNYTFCGNTTCDVVVNQDAHRINLTVFQNKEVLVVKSVYVPAVGESLPQVTNIQTLSEDKVIKVSWMAPIQPVSGYKIDWTQDGSQYHWKESEYTNVTLSGLQEKKPYNITVTPLFDDKTGQGTKVLHVCSSFGDPDSIAITVVPSYRQAFVSWNTKSQKECSGAVQSYTVNYYKTQDVLYLTVTVDNKTRNVSLKDLSPDTQYTVNVDARALTGISTSSDEKFTTTKFDPGLVTPLSVAGSVIIFLVLFLGLCVAVQWKKFQEKPVPNPALSSVGVWASQSQQKGICFQPFRNPSESHCDTVYPEKAQSTSTPSLVTGYDTNTASEYIVDYANSGMTLGLYTEDESPVEPAKTPPSPGESTALISSDSSTANPYRSQSSVESPVPETEKLSKHVPVKQQERALLKTIYVTLDMIEQDHKR
ncbi:interleukin-6 receptor subunit beta isoform X1 [Haplochromis burtoni]|uniref:interleukin-6 receptor subunit beta isoform X1 n=2 Tax=Haplochromis burtoni TaxID=8153 RepID=UPI0006C950BC|nr:interleukin-6 receptor subunit beta isoform X1 [Haplochromis burtoni]